MTATACKISPQEQPRLIGKLDEVRKLIAKAAGNNNPRLPILITGETGTGKEIVARMIHEKSGRQGPFETIDCSALPETLVEAELFGHEKGAFTDAKETKKGLLEAADGGTVFLDEISEMSMRAQVKILRFLQSFTLRRIGGSEDICVNVKIIAATNCNLQNLIQERTFRSDLYYRLCGFPINIPPLNGRKEDIPTLVEHFLKLYGDGPMSIAGNAMAVLQAHSWEGNVRELEHVIMGALARAESNQLTTLEIEPLPTPETDRVESFASQKFGAVTTLEEMTWGYVLHILNNVCDGDHRKACRILGISRSTLYRLLKKIGG